MNAVDMLDVAVERHVHRVEWLDLQLLIETGDQGYVSRRQATIGRQAAQQG